MAKCAYCGSTVVFGGKKASGFTFCNQTCLKNGVLAKAADKLPPEMIQAEVRRVHGGSCPKCHGRGPVDVHVSHRVWSALVLTSWSSRPQVSCRSCGTKSQVGDAVFSLLCGWWGFPWGLLLTPVQIGRNLLAIFKSTDGTQPSEALATLVRADLAVKHLAELRQDASPAGPQ